MVLVVQSKGLVQFAKFPTDWLRLAAVDGRDVSADPLLANPDVVGALDGPMFGDADRLLALYYDRASGLDVPSRRPRDGLTIAVSVEGVPRAEHGARRDRDDRVAVQLYPSLVERGRVVVSGARDSGAEWRAALGLFADGRLGIAAGVGSMVAFARDLERAGCVWAGYTDGGSSTRLLARVRVPHDPPFTQWRRIGPHSAREVPSWIVVQRPRDVVGGWMGAAALLAVVASEVLA